MLKLLPAFLNRNNISRNEKTTNFKIPYRHEMIKTLRYETPSKPHLSSNWDTATKQPNAPLMFVCMEGMVCRGVRCI